MIDVQKCSVLQLSSKFLKTLLEVLNKYFSAHPGWSKR